jgi:hypothetical protein
VPRERAARDGLDKTFRRRGNDFGAQASRPRESPRSGGNRHPWDGLLNPVKRGARG